jgi:deoxyribodipyrimidine photolyase-related protein
MRTLRLVLGDQLNYAHSLVQTPDSSVIWVIMELRQETDYAPHHVQKVIGFFAAMYNYARFLEKKGHQVIHLKINDQENTGSLTENLSCLMDRHAISRFEYFLPDEYRLDVQLKSFASELSIPVRVFDTEHFLTERDELSRFFEGKKEYLMESFYRMMRKKYAVLMDMAGKPLGGKWNYDAENRKKWDARNPLPPPFLLSHDFSEILRELEQAGVKTIGQVDASRFFWPVTRKESLLLLHDFVERMLPHFGTYQDAMVLNAWSLFHSRISFSLNTKMLHPKEVIDAVEQAYIGGNGRISLPQAEGFIRQILGWREYMRGIYWAQMPDYGRLNFFGHVRKLPSWFWTGETKMRCMQQAISQSLEKAYAHHIQRLMVTGSFALMAGIHPDELDRWYLGIYMDAIEWVEITNTRGMSQFADGGIVGTKPYCGSANYMHKMSNYCSNCHYNKDKRYGEKACPLNSLYWDFYLRNREKLEKNPRIGMMYVLLDKMSPEEKEAIVIQAGEYLSRLEKM